LKREGREAVLKDRPCCFLLDESKSKINGPTRLSLTSFLGCIHLSERLRQERDFFCRDLLK